MAVTLSDILHFLRLPAGARRRRAGTGSDLAGGSLRAARAARDGRPLLVSFAMGCRHRRVNKAVAAINRAKASGDRDAVRAAVERAKGMNIGQRDSEKKLRRLVSQCSGSLSRRRDGASGSVSSRRDKDERGDDPRTPDGSPGDGREERNPEISTPGSTLRGEHRPDAAGENFARAPRDASASARPSASVQVLMPDGTPALARLSVDA